MSKELDFRVKMDDSAYSRVINILRYHFGPIPAVPAEMGKDENDQPKVVKEAIPSREATEEEIEQRLKEMWLGEFSELLNRVEKDMEMRKAADKVQPIKLG